MTAPAPVATDEPRVFAAGAVVWRVRRRVLEVLLVHRPRYRDWSWPKGKLEPGETLPECAIREVEEETGVAITLGIPLPSVNYRLADGQRKHNAYWAATALDDDSVTEHTAPGGSTADGVVAGGVTARNALLAARPPVSRASILEIDDSRWMPVDVARAELSRRSDRGPLDALVAAYASGRLWSDQLIVVRHGRARRRASWSGTEEDRPLTGLGERQAAALVPLLAAWGPRRVVSSPWRRCVATVGDYAQALGVDVETAGALSESGAERHPKRLGRIVDDVLTDGSVVLCTHRPVLPAVLDRLGTVLDPPAARRLPAEDPYLRPGHCLVVHLATTATGGRVAHTIETHRPVIG